MTLENGIPWILILDYKAVENQRPVHSREVLTDGCVEPQMTGFKFERRLMKMDRSFSNPF